MAKERRKFNGPSFLLFLIGTVVWFTGSVLNAIFLILAAIWVLLFVMEAKRG